MEQLDLTPWRCPEPLIRLKLWLRQARPGQSVCIQLGGEQGVPGGTGNDEQQGEAGS